MTAWPGSATFEGIESMTLTPDISQTLRDNASELRSKWGWFVALGILMLAVGIIALGNLLMATLVSVYVVGIMMLIGGISEIIQAFSVKNWGGFLLWVASGLLYAIAGILTFRNPVLAAGLLTLLLAISLIASGIARLWVGFRHWSHQGSGWIVFGAIITLACGVLIALRWPINSVWILGMFLAIDMIFHGWTCIALGLGLKSAGK